MKIEVGLSQLDHMSPAALPTGTRSVAIAPIAAVRANAVMIAESANTVSFRADARAQAGPARSKYAAPRKTIPMTAMNSGIASVEVIEPNAVGYAVQKTVSTKISHTWFASQTGP